MILFIRETAKRPVWLELGKPVRMKGDEIRETDRIGKVLYAMVSK